MQLTNSEDEIIEFFFVRFALSSRWNANVFRSAVDARPSQSQPVHFLFTVSVSRLDKYRILSTISLTPHEITLDGTLWSSFNYCRSPTSAKYRVPLSTIADWHSPQIEVGNKRPSTLSIYVMNTNPIDLKLHLRLIKGNFRVCVCVSLRWTMPSSKLNLRHSCVTSITFTFIGYISSVSRGFWSIKSNFSTEYVDCGRCKRNWIFNQSNWEFGFHSFFYPSHLLAAGCWHALACWHFALPVRVPLNDTWEKCIWKVNQILMNAFNSIDMGTGYTHTRCLSSGFWYSDWNPKKESKWYSCISQANAIHTSTRTGSINF